jgi:hypothetical protein
MFTCYNTGGSPSPATMDAGDPPSHEAKAAKQRPPNIFAFNLCAIAVATAYSRAFAVQTLSLVRHSFSNGVSVYEPLRYFLRKLFFRFTPKPCVPWFDIIGCGYAAPGYSCVSLFLHTERYALRIIYFVKTFYPL